MSDKKQNLDQDSGMAIKSRNFELLVLALLVQARGFLPGPGLSRDDASHHAEPRAAHLGLDIDEVLELAWNRGHSWIPR